MQNFNEGVFSPVTVLSNLMRVCFLPVTVLSNLMRVSFLPVSVIIADVIYDGVLLYIEGEGAC